jgi:hypothetical protein
MKEPYTEEVATHGGPESCVDVREGIGEALTGARAGEVWSREIIPPGRRRGSGLGRQHDQVRYPRVPGRSRAVRDPLHAREAPCARTGRSLRPPARDGALGRIGEAEP